VTEESRSLIALGFIAGACTTFSFLPQVYRIWKRRSVADISALMHSVFSLGALLWLLYGIGMHSWPVIAANAVTLALNLWILALKWHFGRSQSSTN
jgi:MtN3 and saliva related transmembrane protein